MIGVEAVSAVTQVRDLVGRIATVGCGESNDMKEECGLRASTAEVLIAVLLEVNLLVLVVNWYRVGNHAYLAVAISIGAALE